MLFGGDRLGDDLAVPDPVGVRVHQAGDQGLAEAEIPAGVVVETEEVRPEIRKIAGLEIQGDGPLVVRFASPR